MALLTDLKNNLLVGDGAMGTLLYSHGVDHCFEYLNITHEQEIYAIHKAYLEAGANVIQTNTYGANRIKLARYGYENQVWKINQKAVQIAKKAVNGDAYVVGTIGGITGIQKNAVDSHEVAAAIREQLDVLLSERVDGILLETFYDLEELVAAVTLTKEKTTIPVIAQLSIHEVGVLQDGTELNEAFKQLEAAGADVVGLNCRLGPYHMIQSLERVHLSKDVYLSAYPNASLPDMEEGRFVYKTNPSYFKETAIQLRKQGVRLIGGCCGTTPEHIEAIAEALHGLDPIIEKDVKERTTKRKLVQVGGVSEKPLHVMVKEKTSVIVELDPPKQLDIDKFMQGARALKKTGVDAITMADNSLATPRISNVAMGVLLKQQVNVRPLVHITCRDRNLIGLQSHLLGLHTLGIDQILAVTGDPTKLGNFPGATSVYDLSSYDLIRLIKQLNEGLSFSGQTLGQNTSFSIAAAFNPNVKQLDRAVKRLEKKIACGADYFMTQPVFSKEKIIDIYEATKHLNAPIYIGIMPLTSYRNAEFLHHEVPGIQLSDHARRVMAACGDDKEKATRASLDLSRELIDTALQYFKGIYLITPFMRYDLTVSLTKYIYEKTNRSFTISEGTMI